MKILIECGLINMKQQGRERYCEARLEQLNEVSVWIEQYRAIWEVRLDSLEIYLEELQSKSVTAKNKKNDSERSTAGGNS